MDFLTENELESINVDNLKAILNKCLSNSRSEYYKVNNDLSNLIDIYDHLEIHQDEADFKKSKLLEFCKETFKYENVIEYAADLIVKNLKDKIA